MRSIRPFTIIASITVLCAAGCTERSVPPTPGDTITWTPRGEIGPGDDQPADDVGRLPGGARDLVATSLSTDFFRFTGAAVTGTASLTDAVVWDPFVSDAPPFGSGGGTIDASVGGASYAVTGGDAFVAEYTDELGVEYLVLSVFSEASTPSGWVQTNVAVFVLKSDFAPGATVALDGIDRVAIFASGPEDRPEPTVFAAAITGAVTFGPTGSATTGDRLSATLTADFAPAESIAPPTTVVGVPLAAGAYDLTIDAVPDVLCGGTMAGAEAAFAGVTLAPIGVSSGAVTLAMPTLDRLTIDGAPIGVAWGAPALLDAVAEPADTYVGLADLTDVGPAGTDLAGAYLLVEGLVETAGLAHAAIGLAYVDPIGDGGCDVVFQATLTTH